LSCFKVHKESCIPKATVENVENEKSLVNESIKTRVSSSEKIEKEYALLSAGQLATLRNASSFSNLISGKNTDLINLMNSPSLKILLQNLLSDIPTSIDLSELTTETSTALETALSIIQKVRTEESGPVINDLENLIDQIHMVSGEYQP
jgi:hypothetical protein